MRRALDPIFTAILFDSPQVQFDDVPGFKTAMLTNRDELKIINPTSPFACSLVAHFRYGNTGDAWQAMQVIPPQQLGARTDETHTAALF